MKKKEYLKPAMETFVMDMQQRILAGSVTSVTTDGLDDPIGISDDEGPLIPGGIPGLPDLPGLDAW